MLPPEIFQCIWDHLPKCTWRRMMSINSTFFHMYLKDRYRKIDITWGTESDWDTIRTLQASPVISGYVRHLALSSLEMRWSDKASLAESINFLSELLYTIKAMVNLTGLSVDIDESFTRGDLPKFLTSLWGIVGKNLQSLELSGYLPSGIYYLPSHTSLPSLRKLIWKNKTRINEDSFIVILTLIRGLAPQIRSLEFCGIFALICVLLPTFPALEELKISLPHIFGLTGKQFRQFLVAQASLSKPLQLYLSMTCISQGDCAAIFSSPSPSLRKFIQLRSLTFKVYPLQEDDGVQYVIPAWCHNLKSLDYFSIHSHSTARSRSDRDAVSIIVSCRQLSSLTLEAQILDLCLLAQLASELPHLDSLSLVQCCTFDPQLISGRRTGSKYVQLRRWNLRDLSIYYGTLRLGRPLSNKTMKQVARLIPSIRSFWGAGDMLTSFPHEDKHWKHSHFMVDVLRSAAYRSLRSGAKNVRSRLPF